MIHKNKTNKNKARRIAIINHGVFFKTKNGCTFAFVDDLSPKERIFNAAVDRRRCHFGSCHFHREHEEYGLARLKPQFQN